MKKLLVLMLLAALAMFTVFALGASKSARADMPNAAVPTPDECDTAPVDATAKRNAARPKVIRPSLPRGTRLTFFCAGAGGSHFRIWSDGDEHIPWGHYDCGQYDPYGNHFWIQHGYC